MAPGTEAPAEMNFLFPDHRALCMAENATHILHNMLTCAARSCATRASGRATSPRPSTASATGPTSSSPRTTGRPGAASGPSGYSPAARPVRLPARPDAAPAQPGLHRRRDRRGHRAAAGAGAGLARARLLRLGEPQRQGRLPALHGLVRRQPRPPVGAPAGEQAKRYVAAMGGIDAVVAHARGLRGPATSAGRPSCSTTRSSPTRTRRRPGAPRRHPRAARLRGRERDLAQLLPGRCHRAAARVLRDAGQDLSPDLLLALTPEQIFDAIAIRVDGPRAWDEALSIGIELTDADEAYRLDLRNGVLVHRRGCCRWHGRRAPAAPRGPGGHRSPAAWTAWPWRGIRRCSRGSWPCSTSPTRASPS